MLNVINRQRVPGGWKLWVEQGGYYADGSARTVTVDVTDAEIAGRDGTQVLQVIAALIDPPDTLAALLAAEPQAVLEGETRAQVELELALNLIDWQGWQFRLDHVAQYGLSGAALTAVTNALTARRNVAAARDLALLQRWRAAPG